MGEFAFTPSFSKIAQTVHIPQVLEFNKYDLYTKDQRGLDKSIEELWEYYDPIIDKYFPSRVLRW